MKRSTEVDAQKRVSGNEKTCIRFPHERLRAMLEGRTKLSGTNFEWPKASPEGVRYRDVPNNSPLTAYEAIFATSILLSCKKYWNGAQKRVSGNEKTCILFPHERLRATLEGRNSPLISYVAINVTTMNRRVISTGSMVPRRGLEPPRPYGH